MRTLYLVRHGRPQAGWNAAYDPGLDAHGWAQARESARILGPLGPLHIVTSPLARARETAEPLAKIWRRTPCVEERLGEVRSPTNDLAERTDWLGRIMKERWPDLDRDLTLWRQGVIDALRAVDTDAVAFTHFIAINVAVGEANADDRVVGFWPDHCSVTKIGVKGKRLHLIELGAETRTAVF
ncbi:MAG: histidine phosphatase family protein [Pseudomonadota bacterium]